MGKWLIKVLDGWIFWAILLVWNGWAAGYAIYKGISWSACISGFMCGFITMHLMKRPIINTYKMLVDNYRDMVDAYIKGLPHVGAFK